MTGRCPWCDQEFDADDDIELSEVILCTNCEREVEVTSLVPLVFTEWEEEEK